MQQTTASGNDIKSLQRDAMQQMYSLLQQNQVERDRTIRLLDEEIELTRERQQYSFWDKLASVMTLGLYAMVKEVCDKWEIEALQEEKKEIRMERLEDLKQLKEIRNALKDASDRAYSGNKWYIPEDRFGNLENLVKSSKMLDDRTRAGLTNYLYVMKDIEKNRIQERNHSKILEKANQNILIGNTGTGYDSYAEKRLNGLKDLAKDMLKTKGLSDEDRKFCEKLTNLTPENEKELKQKLEKPNAFKNFDELKTIVNNLQEKPKMQTVEATQNVQNSKQTQNVQSGQENKTQSNQPINNPEDRRIDQDNQIKPEVQQINQTQQTLGIPTQSTTQLNDDQEFDNLSALISGKRTPVQDTVSSQQPQAQNSSQQKTTSISYNPDNPNLFTVKRQDSKTTLQTKESLQNKIKRGPGGKITVLNQQAVSAIVKDKLKAQGHDNNNDGVDDRNQGAAHGISIGMTSTIKSNVQNSGVQQIQLQVR